MHQNNLSQRIMGITQAKREKDTPCAHVRTPGGNPYQLSTVFTNLLRAYIGCINFMNAFLFGPPLVSFSSTCLLVLTALLFSCHEPSAHGSMALPLLGVLKLSVV